MELFKELTFTSKSSDHDPFNYVSLSALFTRPDGSSISVTGFWAGGDTYKLRYDISIPGKHRYITVSSDDSLNGIKGEITVRKYTGDNPLYVHGAIGRKNKDLYLRYKDGTPFYWLADTWWMGLTDRLDFNKDFGKLTEDRVKKGFNVVQIVAGLYPDMLPFDERGRNEAGFPWTADFKSICPEYFDMADRRIFHLIKKGITPCIVGSWGFFMKFAGKETLLKHWKYLIARWSALPVAWCIAGEANMAFYNENISAEEHLRRSRKDWNDVTLFVKNNDPFKRLITIHPTNNGHEQIEDETLLDLDMLQTGHGGFASIVPQMKQIKHSVDRKALPVINSECNYEGICGSSYCDVQRYVYLSDFMLGAAGHTYGANGIWQLNGIGRPYGPSPHGSTWGDTNWKEAASLPGSGQIGSCKRFLTSFEWWRFQSHPEWVENPCSLNACDGNFCVGIPKEVRIIFKPNLGGSFWGNIEIRGIEKDISYMASRFDPILGKETVIGDVIPDESGVWRMPKVTAFQDWLYILKAKK
ncbi:MAG: DUF4038 domain-containing protein [Clostridia bacterium]|jgi:hypothetical protein